MQVQTVIEKEANVEVTVSFNADNDFHNWTDEEFDHWLDSMDWTQDCDPLGTPEQQRNAEIREYMTTMGEDEYWNQLILDGVISYDDYIYLDY